MIFHILFLFIVLSQYTLKRTNDNSEQDIELEELVFDSAYW